MRTSITTAATVLCLSSLTCAQPDPSSGWTVPGSSERALGSTSNRPRHFQRRAKKGDLYDRIRLGSAYEFGYTSFIAWGQGTLFCGGISWKHGPNLSKAERAYRKAIEEDGKNTLPLVRLGQLLRYRAAKLRQSSRSSRRKKAAACEQEARELLRRAADAGDSEAMVELADMLRAVGEPASSWRPLYERSVSLSLPHRSAVGYIRLLELLLDEGNPLEALRVSEQRERDRDLLLESVPHERRWAKLESREDHLCLRDSFWQLRDQRERLSASLQHVAEQGDVEVMWFLGSSRAEYRFSPTTNRENEVKWLPRAAEAGHVGAMLAMASLLEGPEQVDMLNRVVASGDEQQREQARAELARLQERARAALAEAEARARAARGMVGAFDSN